MTFYGGDFTGGQFDLAPGQMGFHQGQADLQRLSVVFQHELKSLVGLMDPLPHSPGHVQQLSQNAPTGWRRPQGSPQFQYGRARPPRVFVGLRQCQPRRDIAVVQFDGEAQRLDGPAEIADDQLDLAFEIHRLLSPVRHVHKTLGDSHGAVGSAPGQPAVG